MSWERAVWDTPLAIPLIMLPARNERHGGKTGPSYATNAAIDARNRCRQWLETHFEITDRPLHEVGWQLT